MMPILDLLNRMKFDTKEVQEEYVFFYYDRVEDTNRELKFKDIKKVLNLYIIVDKRGRETYVPLHRITEVRRNSRIIWKR